MILRTATFCCLCAFLLGCSRPHNKVIIIQPLGSFPKEKTVFVYNALRQTDSNTILRSTIAMPATAFYAARNRYRADSLISYLGRNISGDTVVIGITDEDISTTKGNVADWGIMGLGYCPGNACIVSTFRLSEVNTYEQLYKVALHELGHTQGLPHCKIKTCYMRDAEGENHLDEETDFCASCKAYLQHKGFSFRDKN